MQEKDVVLIVGPTAVGKSAAAVEIARDIDGEIISADSMQIYRGMDIGTAKPTVEEMKGVKHHLIDEIDPDEPYSVSLFQQRCFTLIDDITARGKIPVIAGGTGLYVNAIIYDLDFAKTVSDEGYRRELQLIAETEGTQKLYEMLMEVSPKDADRIHPNDQKRIIRRLEIIKFVDKCDAGYDFLRKREGYNFILAGLQMEREPLYARINARVDQMVSQGLFDEVKKLYEQYGDTPQSLQAIGYKEIIANLKGQCTEEEAIEQIKKATRNFSKRQMTWFRRDDRIKWFNTTYYPCLKELIDDIIIYIKNRMGKVG